ncbi:hypothetical protein LIN78_11740 [Leeia sp. TBRC 13508]|uniref:HNH endonuclease n=1 Tax=Leeia speluncae TaxID=2884804 RepID=A0ABS8D9D0_9NEIS|nr:hypothetical protein [Leeia speluncae]MCB6184218.1 hypothetical protein [Leeia speluncae]
MSNVIPIRVSNNRVLKQIETQKPAMATTVPLLRNAYLNYHAHKGHPAALVPLTLTEAERNALYDIYQGETQKYEVKWIGKFRNAPNQTYCPLCGSPNPSQLEHYLPRAHYPEFTLLSWNLVPTCAICNPKRGHHAHAPMEEMTLVHPYYEEMLFTQNLFSVLIVPPFSAVSFVPVTCPGPFSQKIIRRLERQIEICFDKEKLNRWLANKLWKEMHAELSGIATQKDAMAKIVNKLKIYQKTTGSNSWDSIFFRGLIADDNAVQWLCNTPSDILY